MLGALLMLVAAIGFGVGGLWAVAKAGGAEVDYCDGPNCVSGWYPAGAILVVAVVLAFFGVWLLRRGPQRRI